MEYKHANGLRAWVYRALDAVDAAFAREMHADGWPKPVTLSPLWWREGCWVLELAILYDPMTALLLQGMAATGKAITLGRETYTVGDVRIDTPVALEDFLRVPAEPRRWQVDFLTPTAHQQTMHPEDDAPTTDKMRKSLPLPDPTLAFTSWFHKWNGLLARLQCEPMPASILRFFPYLVVSRFEGRTLGIPLQPRRPFIGYIGMAVFQLLDNLDISPAEWAMLHTLAAFANYCGTGAELMRGMGQTRVRMN